MMNKSDIEWCDFSWNPITGCLHDCSYCYARKQAQRFCGDIRLNKSSEQLTWITSRIRYDSQIHNIYALDEPFKNESGRTIPLPAGFDPTFHKYRLPMPAQKKKPANIFVGSMADVFGEWVPDEWIKEVFSACAAAPWHNYLFLTKNPARFQDVFLIQSLHITKNMWFGFSVTDQKHLNETAMAAKWLPQNSFISVEPIHGEIDLTRIESSGIDAFLNFLDGGQYWFMGGNKDGKRLRWVIVGAETGQRREKVTPLKQWIEKIVRDCRGTGVPVLLKDSNEMMTVWGEDLIKEYPTELQRKEIIIPHCHECKHLKATERHVDPRKGTTAMNCFCTAGIAHKRIGGRYARTSPPWCPKRGAE
ncbi:MAG: phage Gp37/Gp68 family protein [Oscillospiraceae bacterium]|jgi:protein gp37|nr:phage Gp37/Gp68 family protein [Oscillospiraceae bacterium]